MDSLIGIAPLKGWVFIDIYDDGSIPRVIGGKKIIIPSDSNFGTDNGHHTHRGLRPRWAYVLAVSKDAKEAGLNIGDKVLCDQLKWTRGISHDDHRKFWAIKMEDILVIDDDGLTFEEKELVHKRQGIAD